MLKSFLELWWLFTYLFKQLLQVCNSNLLQAENMKHKFSSDVLKSQKENGIKNTHTQAHTHAQMYMCVCI